MSSHAATHPDVIRLHPAPAERAAHPLTVRIAFALSGAVAALMVVASVWGLFAPGFYHDGAWAREALRGGDLVSLLVGVPLLLIGLIGAMRGSVRAQVLWIGALVYVVYDYAFYAFGAAFNDLFLAHIALVAMGGWALICAVPHVPTRPVRHALRDRASRWYGLFLAVVGALQGALWVFVLVRYDVTGEVMKDVPVSGQHLVFALDLALLVPALMLGGILLFRDRALGYLMGGAMAVMGAAYQLNLMAAAAFQHHAGVAGVAFPAPESIGLTAAFVSVALLLLLPKRAAPPPAQSSSARRSFLT
jgi:hypothetical protein